MVTSRIKFHRKPEAPSIPMPGQAYGYEECEDGTLKKQDPPDKDKSIGPAFYNPTSVRLSHTFIFKCHQYLFAILGIFNKGYTRIFLKLMLNFLYSFQECQLITKYSLSQLKSTENKIFTALCFIIEKITCIDISKIINAKKCLQHISYLLYYMTYIFCLMITN